MRWHRIRAILLHSYYHFFRSPETLIDLVWFTFVQFLIFGFLSKLLVGASSSIGSALMLGLLFWETVRIGQYCMSVSILWEIWSKSLSSMFVTPLTLWEMLVGQAIAGIIKIVAVIGSLAILAQLFFHAAIFDLGPMLGIYFFLLILFSYSAGMFVVALIFRYGTDIQSLAWGLIYILQPISAVFYPISALPTQIQWMAYLSPITYVMETARYQLETGNIRWDFLLSSLGLNVIYFLLAVWYTQKMFKVSKHTGSFARLGN